MIAEVGEAGDDAGGVLFLLRVGEAGESGCSGSINGNRGVFEVGKGDFYMSSVSFIAKSLES